jgi:hypothetical protein
MLECVLAAGLIAFSGVPCILQSVRGVQPAGAAVEAGGVGGAAAEDYEWHAVQVL